MKKGVAGFLILFVSVTVFAQDKSAIRKVLDEIRMEEEQQTEAQKKVRTVYDEGFTMVGEDDTLKIGAWMQNDLRIFPEGHPGQTQFLVRRARIDIRGSLEKIFSVQVMGEFEGDGGTNAANLKQGFLEYNQFPAFRIRAGQFKEPYGLENLYADLWLDFAERPIAENFIRPEQDLGLMFFGKLLDKRLEYGLGLFNGSGTNVAESNDDKDIAARLVVAPLAPSSNKWLNKLNIGGSFTYGKQTATLDNTGPTTPVGTRFLTFSNPTGSADVRTDNFRTRAGADMEWLVGPFSAKGEYAYSRFRAITFRNASRGWAIHGWSGQLTYLLTGEEKKNQGSVLPKNNFDPKAGTWGAWELAARGEVLRTDQGLLNANFANGSDDALSASGGVNWYLNRHIRLMANYIFTQFHTRIANANAAHEHAGILRFQFNL